jgi:hypothetical protein
LAEFTAMRHLVMRFRGILRGHNADKLDAWLRDAQASGILRWSPSVGQFGGLDKLGSGCRQAANFSVPVALYASSGVRPASIEWGRRVL